MVPPSWSTGTDHLPLNSIGMAKFLAGYASEIADEDCRKRYEEKISNIGMDPYDADKASFYDNVDLWPAITSIHLACTYYFPPVLIQEMIY